MSAPKNGVIYDSGYEEIHDVRGGVVRFLDDYSHHTVYGEGIHTSWDEYEDGWIDRIHTTFHGDGGTIINW